MAEQTQEKRTFKWGDREYLLDDLLAEHAKRELEYYNFARLKGQYDDTALQGLRSAISNRIAAVKSGQSFDGDGVLAGDRVDNTSIQTLKKGLFKKEKYVDQDNTEWAKYYLNKLVGQLNPYTRDEKESGWDLTKHGLGAYLTGLGLNAKDIFEKYDLRDKENPENPRSFDQRRALLKQHLGGYKDWLAKKGFDFTKNDNEWDDNFGADFDKFVLDYDSLDINGLTSALRKFGAGDSYTDAFTSDRWDMSKTNEEMEEELKRLAEEKRVKEEKEKYSQYAKDTYNAYANLSDNNLGGTYFTSAGDGLFEMSDDEYDKWLNTHTEDADTYMRLLQASYYKNPFDAKIAGEYLPLAGRFGALKEVNIDGKTWMYDPRTIDRQNNRVAVFDPESGEMKHTFIGDVEEEWKNMRRKWRIDNGYEDAADKYTQYNALGGILSMQTGGGFNLAQSVNRDLEERNKIRAEENGNTEDVQKARDRVVSNGKQRLRSEKDSIGQPDAGFSGAEVARLATIAADITSMFLDPVTGTAVGLGSTLTNFGADIADDGFLWSDVKNLGINAGFDLLGAIPLFGDALGTGTKITRQLVKWAPRAMAGLAAFQGVRNLDGMMDSWGKLTSGDKDQKLTVQDWRNIAQSISLLTGGVRAAKNKAAQSKMKSQARVDGVVGVNVRNKQTGQIELILVDGDIAKAVSGGKSKAQIETELSKLELFKDKFGENGIYEVNTRKDGSWQSPIGRRKNDVTGKNEFEYRGFRKEGVGDVNEIFDFSNVKGYEGSRGYRIPGVSDYLNTKHQEIIARLNNGQPPQTVNAKGAKTSAEIDAEVERLRKPVDDELQILQDAMTKRSGDRARINQQLAPEKAKLAELQKRLHGIADEPTLQIDRAKAEQNIAGIDGNINKVRQDLAQAEFDLQSLQGSRVPKKNLAAHAQLVAAAEAKVKGIQNQIVLLEAAKKVHQAEIAKIDGHINDYAALAPRQAEVQRLQDLYKHLGRGTHTNSYNRLRQMIADLQAQHSVVEGRQVTWDMNAILDKAGIKGAYAKGGSINRNKINKFLNYAKG